MGASTASTIRILFYGLVILTLLNSVINTAYFTSYQNWNDESDAVNRDVTSKIAVVDQNVEGDAVTQNVTRKITVVDQVVMDESPAMNQDAADESDVVNQNVADESDAVTQDVTTEIAVVDQNVADESDAVTQDVTSEIAVVNQNVADESDAVTQDVTTEIAVVNQNVADESDAVTQDVTTEIAVVNQNVADESDAVTQDVTTEIAVVNQNVADESVAVNQNPTDRSAGGTFSLLFPIGLLGGYRNQAMRFVAFLKMADRDGMQKLLLPTLVFNTRYLDTESKKRMNPGTRFWPVPFEDLFDVDHWNSYHRPTMNSTEIPSMPMLVPSLDSTIQDDNGICWKPTIPHERNLMQAIEGNPIWNASVTHLQSFLPLLTYRMLFETSTNIKAPRATFILKDLQEQVLDYLLNTKKKRPQKMDFRYLVKNCTQPYVYGGNSNALWYSFLDMEKRAPGVLPKQNSNTLSTIEEGQQQLQSQERLEVQTGEQPQISTEEETTSHRRLKRKRKPKDDEPSRYETRFANTVDEALVPAKPWRQLADQCVQHHLGLGLDEFLWEENDPHRIGHDHGYIALHPRVEPEMLSHKCGRDLERNLTTIFDLTEGFAIKRNSQLDSTSNHRPLKGVFVAVGRDQMQLFNKDQEAIARYNWNILNHRSVSYDSEGNEQYSSSLLSKEKQMKGTNSSWTVTGVTQNNLNVTIPHDIPIFECGEGWLEHAFYRNENQQRILFTPSNPEEALKPYGLYRRYGSDSNMLPLPNNYYGDILPSIINFWLAVNADIFVGVFRSSWSNDIWTTRYYQGKGDRNFKLSSENGIEPVENNGLPPPHSCD